MIHQQFNNLHFFFNADPAHINFSSMISDSHASSSDQTPPSGIPLDIPEQQLTPSERKGFTVVEWGDSDLDMGVGRS